MGRPIPRFHRRSGTPSPYPPRSRPIHTTPVLSNTENDADLMRHTGPYHPLAVVYPYRGQPEETHIPMRQNPVYFHAEESSSPTLIVPPWRRNDPAYGLPFHQFNYGPQPAPYDNAEHRRRISVTGETPYQQRMTQIQESNNHLPSESMPEDYRAALRLVIANLVLRDLETRSQTSSIPNGRLYRESEDDFDPDDFIP